MVTAILKENDGSPITGNYLVALSVCWDVSSSKVVFGVGYHNTGGGSLFGTIEDAADTTVAEYVADAKFIGIVNPFNDVRTTLNAPRP